MVTVFTITAAEIIPNVETFRHKKNILLLTLQYEKEENIEEKNVTMQTNQEPVDIVGASIYSTDNLITWDWWSIKKENLKLKN